MSAQLWIAAAVLVITFAMISLRRLPGIEIGMWLAAAIGAVLMVIGGAAPLDRLADYLNTDVILLLLGMMLLVASLDACGFFELTVRILLKGSSSGKRLLALVMLLAAFLSAIVLNDAVVLLMTPVVIRCCRKVGCDPIPYLVGVFAAANIGSTATAIGNPQNAYIATSAGIGFLTFSQYLFPLMLVCLVLSYGLMVMIFRKRLQIRNPCPDTETPVFDARLYPVTAVMIAMVVMFALSHTLNIPLWIIAITGGSASAAIASTMGARTAVSLVKRVDWSVLIFFIGLFIVMAGVVESGLLDAMIDAVPGVSDSGASVGGLTVITAVLSNLISNVPCVILLGGMIPTGDLQLWLTLAAVSTLAGNMTMIGAAANVIVSEEAEKDGIRIDFWKYLKIGIPVSLATLLVTFAYMVLVF